MTSCKCVVIYRTVYTKLASTLLLIDFLPSALVNVLLNSSHSGTKKIKASHRHSQFLLNIAQYHRAVSSLH